MEQERTQVPSKTHLQEATHQTVVPKEKPPEAQERENEGEEHGFLLFLWTTDEGAKNFRACQESEVTKTPALSSPLRRGENDTSRRSHHRAIGSTFHQSGSNDGLEAKVSEQASNSTNYCRVVASADGNNCFHRAYGTPREITANLGTPVEISHSYHSQYIYYQDQPAMVPVRR